MAPRKKDKRIDWIYFTERVSSDFPFLIAYHFFIGHFKYLKFRNLFYLNKYPNLYSYRGGKELGNIYKRIKSFKKKDLIKDDYSGLK